MTLEMKFRKKNGQLRTIEICRNNLYYRKRFGLDEIFDEFCHVGWAFGLGPFCVEVYY